MKIFLAAFLLSMNEALLVSSGPVSTVCIEALRSKTTTVSKWPKSIGSASQQTISLTSHVETTYHAWSTSTSAYNTSSVRGSKVSSLSAQPTNTLYTSVTTTSSIPWTNVSSVASSLTNVSSVASSLTNTSSVASSLTNISSVALSQATVISNASDSPSSSPSTSPSDSLTTFSGPQNGTTPPWKVTNTSCYDMYLLSGQEQWAAVNGDLVAQKFDDMFSGNKLMCSECFDMDPGLCTSKNPGCKHGLRDLATIANTSGQARWDTAVAIFAQAGDDTDLVCDIGVGECSSPPKCELLDGPGAWALMKSVETMHNALQNIYDSIQAAGDAAGHQMQAFSAIFAPVPSFKSDAIWMTVMIAIIGAIIGAMSFGVFMPEVMGAYAITLAGEAAVSVPLMVSTAITGITGVAAGVGENIFFFGMPSPGDTDSPLGTIISATLLTYSNLCDRLMSEGSYDFVSQDGKTSTTVTMQKRMMNGALMQSDANITKGFVALQPVMELIMFQQLALYTWQNLESQDVESTPYIVYDNVPCDQLNVTQSAGIWGEPSTVFGSNSILSVLPGIYNLDANITYNGKCYWLLDGKPTGSRVFSKKVAPSFHCRGDNALPGATNKILSKNAGIFANMSLEHWIIPSVRGWEQNHNQNGYPMASSNGILVSNPLQAAAVNVPVCEYLRNPKNPGIGCPKLNEHQTKKCAIYPPSMGVNQPGDFNAGRCNAHVYQYKRNQGNAVNPLSSYQLSISIYDANGIPIGQAVKQSAATALSIVDSSLPYDLVVDVGMGDDDTVSFWYSDQYWNSTSCGNKGPGGYDHGMRQMDCPFNCPMPSANPPVSATAAHPFPDAPTAAIGSNITYANTFITSTPTPTPTGPPPPPIYATGQCGIHVIQYKQQLGTVNPTDDYLIEAIIFDGKQKQIGQPALVQAPPNVPVSVLGLVSPFTITAGPQATSSLVCTFNGKAFSIDKATCGKKAIGGYDHGSRNMDCGFQC